MRRTPLRRTGFKPGTRKPLNRTGSGLSNSPLPVCTKPLKRTRIRPVSRRRVRENRQRRLLLDELYAAAPWCAKCMHGYRREDLDGHELLSRARGGSILDGNNIVLLCRLDHSWITEHPDEAAADGWALSQFGEKTT